MIENPPSAGFLLPAIYGGNLSGAQIKLGAAHGRDYRFAGMARSYGNAVHFRSHAFYSPLPFMGEGLGGRAENTAKLEASLGPHGTAPRPPPAPPRAAGRRAGP